MKAWRRLRKCCRRTTLFSECCMPGVSLNSIENLYKKWHRWWWWMMMTMMGDGDFIDPSLTLYQMLEWETKEQRGSQISSEPTHPSTLLTWRMVYWYRVDEAEVIATKLHIWPLTIQSITKAKRMWWQTLEGQQSWKRCDSTLLSRRWISQRIR